MTREQYEQLKTTIDEHMDRYYNQDAPTISDFEYDRLMQVTNLVMLDIKTLDDSLHKSYTGATRQNNHRWMEYLQEIGKPTWIRHVVVPTITDNEERLNALVGYISQYSCIERVELLGYHVMGEAKYQNMHIPYPLHGIPPLQPERLNKIREMFRQKLNIKVL